MMAESFKEKLFDQVVNDTIFNDASVALHSDKREYQSSWQEIRNILDVRKECCFFFLFYLLFVSTPYWCHPVSRFSAGWTQEIFPQICPQKLKIQ